jgi:hypothetical protein
MAKPPEEMMRPSLGEQLDAAFARDAAAVSYLTDRMAQFGAQLARVQVDLADFQSALAVLQRRIGRHP